MSTLKIHVGVTKAIDKMRRDFLWEDINDRHKLNSVAWSTLSKPTFLGGLGIRNLSSNNLDFLAKMAWRIFSNLDSSLGKLLNAKYFRSSSFWHCCSKPKISYFWSSILNGRDILMEGLRWKIGNGLSVSFWHDIWIQNLPLASFLNPDCPFDYSLKVSDLINHSTGQWNLSYVASILLHIFWILLSLYQF